MQKLLIVADDLTGALDTGVQLAQQGFGACVTPYTAPLPDAEVAIVNTQSRHVAPHIAFARVQNAVLSAVEQGYDCFYKKTDSLLRGNTGAEIEAVLSATNSKQAFFVPAYPQIGRTTVLGQQYANGLPIHQTAAAQDAQNPVHTANITDILRDTTDALAFCVPVGGVMPNDGGIVIFDAQTQPHLEALATKLQNKTAVFAGCAGFAPYLHKVFALSAETKHTPILCKPKHMLTVCGSLHPASRRQIEVAQAAGVPALEISVEELRMGALKTAKQQQAASFLNAQNLILYTTSAMVGNLSANFAAQSLAGIVKAIASRSTALCVFGGDTAEAVFTALDIGAVYPLYEFAGGIPVCAAYNTAGQSRTVITKAGSFGAEDTIIMLHKHILGG